MNRSLATATGAAALLAALVPAGPVNAATSPPADTDRAATAAQDPGWARTGNDLSELELIPANGTKKAPGRWSYLRFKHSNKCLTVMGASKRNGAYINQYRCLWRRNQQWQFERVAGFFGVIRNAHSGKCFDLGRGGKKGTKLWQWKCHGKNNQKFALMNPWIRSFKNYALDVTGGSKADNAPVVVWTVKRVKNQYIYATLV
ncbi:RICIN domain-containing protein [Actinomadura fulvescens]|uniref:RICIN domain-containing protein n=1 Tax=Actinomadura fulvescens TaxID=46160 RepID=A0ABN3PEH8_9ACTN